MTARGLLDVLNARLTTMETTPLLHPGGNYTRGYKRAVLDAREAIERAEGVIPQDPDAAGADGKVD